MATRAFKWYGKEWIKHLDKAEHMAMARVGAFLERKVKRSFGGSPSAPDNPPGRDTGKYGRSISHELGTKVGNVVARVGTNDKRGPWLEFGTGRRSVKGGSPYVIEPVRSKFLSFKGKDGSRVFVKKVVHPGIHPRPHIGPAINKNRRAMGLIIRRTLEEELP